jgi:hypothetical protein
MRVWTSQCRGWNRNKNSLEDRQGLREIRSRKHVKGTGEKEKMVDKRMWENKTVLRVMLCCVVLLQAMYEWIISWKGEGRGGVDDKEEEGGEGREK